MHHPLHHPKLLALMLQDRQFPQARHPTILQASQVLHLQFPSVLIPIIWLRCLWIRDLSSLIPVLWLLIIWIWNCFLRDECRLKIFR
ncbi:hypothetical protein GIB67_000732 [Kingdonia uniflora]|uniref:Uncharacterized protein n=1 Tax=Kingdonia uniflora TaxID=39325 RepID=A0A7J7NE52_9MAGN|nr:hypothetical protein GIB67_000732 [Kingdonia uniflora]